MFSKLLIAWGLMALCVVIHATGVNFAVRWLRYSTTAAHQFWWLEVAIGAALLGGCLLLFERRIAKAAWALARRAR